MFLSRRDLHHFFLVQRDVHGAPFLLSWDVEEALLLARDVVDDLVFVRMTRVRLLCRRGRLLSFGRGSGVLLGTSGPDDVLVPRPERRAKLLGFPGGRAVLLRFLDARDAFYQSLYRPGRPLLLRFHPGPDGLPTVGDVDDSLYSVRDVRDEFLLAEDVLLLSWDVHDARLVSPKVLLLFRDTLLLFDFDVVFDQ